MSTDVNALQLLPEAEESSHQEQFIATCWDPTCIITYCPVPNTTVG